MISLALLVAYLMLVNRLRKKPATIKNPGLLRLGSFSQYAKSRHTSFRRPGALALHVKGEAAVPEEDASQELSPPEETPPSQEETPDAQETPSEETGKVAPAPKESEQTGEKHSK